MKKRIVLILLVIVLLAAMGVSCAPKEEPETSGLGLTFNAFQKHDGWIYYIGDTEKVNLYRVRENGKDKMLIVDEPIYSFEVFGDRIYYIDRMDWYPYSINIDGSDKEMITPSGWQGYHISVDSSGNTIKTPSDYEFEGLKVVRMDISDDWIYVIPIDRGALYRVKIGSTEFIKLDDSVMDFSVDGEWIYYLHYVLGEGALENRLWRMRTDGTQKQQLMQDTSSSVDYDDNWIFYVDDNKSIYKVGFDGNGKQEIVDYGKRPIKVIGDWLFYSGTGESSGMYKIKTDGSERTKITDDTVIYFLDIWDNWLICSGRENIVIIRVSDSYDTDEIVMEIMSDWPDVEIYK